MRIQVSALRGSVLPTQVRQASAAESFPFPCCVCFPFGVKFSAVSANSNASIKQLLTPCDSAFWRLRPRASRPVRRPNVFERVH